MIFNVKGHIEKIINGTKTQTRRRARANGRIYLIGKTYSIQPKRTALGIPEGRIKIMDRWLELDQDKIDGYCASAEGDYTPEEYESLFEELNPNWRSRYCYKFEFIPSLRPSIIKEESI